jgi:hypothetical protein
METMVAAAATLRLVFRAVFSQFPVFVCAVLILDTTQVSRFSYYAEMFLEPEKAMVATHQV